MNKIQTARESIRSAQSELHEIVKNNGSEDYKKLARAKIINKQFECYRITGNVNDLPRFCGNR